jgi:E3 ubiquitin-protein ligase HECTD2
MPSWSYRQDSSPSTSSSNVAPSSFSTPLRGTKRNVSSPFDYTLPPLYSTSPTVPGRRAHSRSISHPFPSIRSGPNKKGDVAISKRDYLDSDDDDDDDDDDGVSYISDPRSKSPRKHPPRWTPAEEFVSGKCMTCDSTVRWPRPLKVYRCTVCLTVNDLEPCPGSQGHGPARNEPIPKIKRKGEYSPKRS